MIAAKRYHILPGLGEKEVISEVHKVRSSSI